jgi:hypothetical protein
LDERKIKTKNKKKGIGIWQPSTDINGHELRNVTRPRFSTKICHGRTEMTVRNEMEQRINFYARPLRNGSDIKLVEQGITLTSFGS